MGQVGGHFVFDGVRNVRRSSSAGMDISVAVHVQEPGVAAVVQPALDLGGFRWGISVARNPLGDEEPARCCGGSGAKAVPKVTISGREKSSPRMMALMPSMTALQSIARWTGRVVVTKTNRAARSSAR